MADTLNIRIVGLVLIAISSAFGVGFPFCMINRMGLNVMESVWFGLLQCFAVGLIIGVAILHVFADGQERLSSVTEYPAAEAIMLLGLFLMIALNRIVERITHSHAGDHCQREPEAQLQLAGRQVSTHSTTSIGSHGSGVRMHAHDRLLMRPDVEGNIVLKMKAYLLELAIAVHSVLVGLGLGIIDKSPSDALVLSIALCFHQFFEGIALGMSGVKSQLSRNAAIYMVLIFMVGCPFGVLLGIWAANSMDEDSPTTAWVLGSLNCMAAGTLLEIGCVDMLPTLFSHRQGHDDEGMPTALVEFARLLSLLLGGVIMAVLAIWA